MILLSPPVRLFACAAVTIGLCVASGAALAGSASPGLVQVADAASDAAEKSAFEAAKELGTVEAWEAFLKNFPKGFHADLARAYLSRLAAGQTQVPAASPAPAQPVMQAVAGEHPCAELPSLRSLNSDTRASITFRNQSGMMRGIMWVDFQGQLKPYADLQSGQQVVFDSYLTHPWMVTDGPGNCLRIVLPEPGGSVVILEPDYQAPSSSGQVEYVPPAKAKKTVKAKTPSCGKGKMLVDGRCIAKRDKYTFCGPGYRVKGNKCVPGYKAPPPDAPLSTEQSNAVAQGCPTGQVWNEAEGCHEDD